MLYWANTALISTNKFDIMDMALDKIVVLVSALLLNRKQRSNFHQVETVYVCLQNFLHTETGAHRTVHKLA